jgi:PGF-pre-PGF domain-containing protein/PGF-CTERM protein
MSRRALLIGLVAAVVVSVGIAPAPAAAQELNIEDVEVPNSVTTDESFDVVVDVSAEDVGDVSAVLGLPSQLSCSPEGSQSISIESGSGSATFSCEADAPGDYNGGIDVSVSGETTDGDPISDSTRTGLTVRSPASLSLATSLDADSIETGDSTTLTVSISNSGDVATSYDLSASPDAGLSVTGSGSGSVDGGATAFETYTLTGDSTGDQDVTITLTGGNGQEITDVATVSVESSGGDGGDGGGGGGGSASTAPEVVDSEAIEALDPPADVELQRAEQAQITVDEETGQASVTFTEESTTERITFDDGDVEGEVTVADYDAAPAETGPSPGASVSVSQIEVPDPDRSATIRKRVSRARLEEIEADAADLRISRFDDEAGEWQLLDTEVVESGEERVVLEADTPGFSFFAVSAVSVPEATVDAPSEVTVGEGFTLDASGSSDRYGEIVAYEWRVDGETLTGETVTTAIDTAGDVTVELTVENDAGETDTETATVSVSEADADDEQDGNADSDADTDTDTEIDTDAGDEQDAEPEPDDQPGFGAVTALLALLGTALFAKRRM